MSIKETFIKLMRPINIPLTKFVLTKHYRDLKTLSDNKGAKRVLVLAPHMDDETIGPGGTIRRHVNEGAEVYCVFITDGSNSVSDLSKEELVKARIHEVNQVKNILGLKDIHYMGLPDGNVESTPEAQVRLKALIEEINPDMIYSTLFVDAHPDHTNTAKLLSDTLKQLSPNNYIIRLYEINCAIPPQYMNCVIDISSTIEQKEQAIEQFESQAIAFDGFIFLNKVKSNMVQENVTAVEGFLELSVDELIYHHEKLEKHNGRYPKLFKQVNRTDTLLWAIYQNLALKKQMFETSLKK
ncbi:PIG-L family deacetylase [Bacillaceae bacterium S4-13-58]